MSYVDAAAIISAATGRQITHLDLDREQWIAATVNAGVPDDYALMLTGSFDVIRSGAGAATTTTVRDVLQRDPIHFHTFAAAAKDAWQPAGPSR